MAQELNKVMGLVCERERYYYNAKKVDAVLAEKDARLGVMENQARMNTRPLRTSANVMNRRRLEK